MAQHNAQQLSTGTTTLAILCKNGIVLGADKRVTSGYQVANKTFMKVIQISDNMAITTAGLVSDAQLLARIAKAEIKLKDIQTNRKTTMVEAANLLASLSYSNFRKYSAVQGIVGFLLGGRDDSGNYIYEIGIDGSVQQVESFVTDGSGSVYALGVLETLFKKDMSLDEGIALAEKALNAALQRDIMTGNGIDIFTITEKGVTHVVQKLTNPGLPQ